MANSNKKNVTKKVISKNTVKPKKKNITSNKKKVSSNKNTRKKDIKIVYTKFGENKRNIFITLVLIFILAILLIVSTYAWFSTAS